MKLKFKKEVLQNAVEKAMTSLGKDGGIFLQSNGSKTLVCTCNGTVQTMVQVEVEGDQGSLYINGRIFSALLSASSKLNENYELSVGESEIEIRAGKVLVTKLPLMDTSMYNPLDVTDEDQQINIAIKSDTFKSVVDKGSFAFADHEETRPILKGCLIEIAANAKTIAVTSLDGFRIAHCEDCIDYIDTEQDIQFVVPAVELKRIVKAIDTEMVNIVNSSKNITIRTGDTIYILQKLEGQYLDYKKIVEQEFPISVKINKSELLNAINICSVIMDSLATKSPLIKLLLKDEKLVVESTAKESLSSINIPVEQTGEDITIGFNGRYLKDVYRIESKELTIMLIDPLKPALILPCDEKEKFFYFVLPVKL